MKRKLKKALATLTCASMLVGAVLGLSVATSDVALAKPAPPPSSHHRNSHHHRGPHHAQPPHRGSHHVGHPPMRHVGPPVWHSYGPSVVYVPGAIVYPGGYGYYGRWSVRDRNISIAHYLIDIVGMF